MPVRRNLLGLAFAAAALGFAGAAEAASAYASSTVNVRSGAGTNFTVVDVLRPGERVDIDYCRGAWCYVTKSGPDGWVSASYLSAARYDEDEYDDDYYDDRDDFYVERPRFRPRPFPSYGSQFCFGGYYSSFCVRD